MWFSHVSRIELVVTDCRSLFPFLLKHGSLGPAGIMVINRVPPRLDLIFRWELEPFLREIVPRLPPRASETSWEIEFYSFLRWSYGVE